VQEHPPVAEAVHDDRPYGWQRWVYSTDHKDILDLLVFLLGMAYAFARKVHAPANPWGAGATTRMDAAFAASLPQL